ncbi:DNA/RNA non-specific endonuclease [Pseudocitrobacter sp. RIT415]|uniref:DNA/RNA non-specific endonuclease n=1 Tax=Pseudocitrobacter sp. RIT415 TaxID=2202163 RepID=UPI00272A3BFF|nr:DNA/RNA non-specific endonuclease [Pseudocitrobacter sp. RIT 415]
MALSASEKRYADGSLALREQWHYRGGFELRAKERRAANDDRSYFYPIVTGPDGAPQEMYSANGQKVWTKHRSLWGLAANDSPDNGRESCDAGFAGQWQDEESGLWYNLHRYYDAGTGQYLSPDPLKLSGGLNTQSYVHDPVGWCDPWGLAGCPPDIEYGPLDELGRPTGVKATLTRDMMGTGTKANSAIEPPGWSGNGTKYNQGRGHLLGRQLGGSGDVPENLVTLQQNPVNSPVMRDFEGQVRVAVEKGETIEYTSTPVYKGDNLAPRGVTITAKGDQGFNLDVTILNPIGN